MADNVNNKKLSKLDVKYLKNIKTLKKESYIAHEIGEIDFLAIPANELIKVLNNVERLNFKHNYDKNDAKITDQNYYYLTNEMEKYRYSLMKNFKLNEKSLFNLIKKFICVVKGTEKYQTFAKILNSTCKLSFMNYGDRIDTSNQKEDTYYKHIDKYTLTMKKPIPLEIVQEMKNEINKSEREKIKNDIDEFIRAIKRIDEKNL